MSDASGVFPGIDTSSVVVGDDPVSGFDDFDDGSAAGDDLVEVDDDFDVVGGLHAWTEARTPAAREKYWDGLTDPQRRALESGGVEGPADFGESTPLDEVDDEVFWHPGDEGYDHQMTRMRAQLARDLQLVRRGEVLLRASARTQLEALARQASEAPPDSPESYKATQWASALMEKLRMQRVAAQPFGRVVKRHSSNDGVNVTTKEWDSLGRMRESTSSLAELQEQQRADVAAADEAAHNVTLEEYASWDRGRQYEYAKKHPGGIAHLKRLAEQAESGITYL